MKTTRFEFRDQVLSKCGRVVNIELCSGIWHTFTYPYSYQTESGSLGVIGDSAHMPHESREAAFAYAQKAVREFESWKVTP